MTRREERVARNEATSREINERIEDAHEGDPADDYVRVVCECGQESCDRLIAITIPEYERVRGDSRRFAVVRDHVMGDVERVVDETERFVVVVTREGSPAETRRSRQRLPPDSFRWVSASTKEMFPSPPYQHQRLCNVIASKPSRRR